MSTTPATPHHIIMRKVVDWAVWDWGSVVFSAVVMASVFTTFPTSDGVFTDSGTVSTWLSSDMTIAGIFIALLAPITGQRVGRQGKGGVWLGWSTGTVAARILVMHFVHPASVLGPQDVLMLGIALLGLGNVFFEFASANYNAMISRLGGRENRGKIFGFDRASGYIDDITLLFILYVGLISVNLLGIPTDGHLNIRTSMVIATLWLGGLAIPVIVDPPLLKKVLIGGGSESIIGSYKFLWCAVRTLKREAPYTLFFLIAPAVFRDGLAGIFILGTVLTKTAFGSSASEVSIFIIVASVVADLATVVFGWADDKIGPKKVIILSLCAMVIAGFGVFLPHARGPTVLWSLGLVLYIFVGSTQSTLCSFLSCIIPASCKSEVFGLYVTTGHAVSFMVPMVYSLFLLLGKHMTSADRDYIYWDVLGIMLILGAGLALTIPVEADRATLDRIEN